jgi:hypothetical protein
MFHIAKILQTDFIANNLPPAVSNETKYLRFVSTAALRPPARRLACPRAGKAPPVKGTAMSRMSLAGFGTPPD